MTWYGRRKIAASAAGALVCLAAHGCADPCFDDGLMQDPGDEDDCPAVGSNAETDDDDDSSVSTTSVETDTGGDACSNGVRDGGETDVDCGGSCEAGCGNGQGCDGNDDCDSGVCSPEGVCVPPSCEDGQQNGDETDVDCGGSCSNDCGTGQGCSDDDDCMSMNCEGGTCQPPPSDCNDGMQNGDETDVDCGGSCPGCNDGENCVEDDDCMSMACDGRSMTCASPSCRDGVQNGDETDVDCGGSCPGCADGENCIEDGDCLSGQCDDGTMTCATPTCDDGVQNGDETDVDCGGSCPGCDDGGGCMEDDDCLSQVCDEGAMTCLAPACDDGTQNGNESDLDCGGTCGNTCETGEVCNTGADCIDDVCDPGNNTCAPALTVDATPACSTYDGGMPAMLLASAVGGTGMYSYLWMPPDDLSDPTSSMPNATPPAFVTYTVTVDDGVNQAQDSVTVINSEPFSLGTNCTLYQGDFGMAGPASIQYSMGGTRACELGNNDFGLHLCEGVTFQDVQLQGVLEVTNAGGDDDFVGLVWGAQNSSTFYSMSWKGGTQNIFGCNVEAGVIVKRVEAPDFASLDGQDVYCPFDTANSTLLLGPAATTTQGWQEGEEYLVTIDYLTTGSTITITRISDNMMIAMFDVPDATFASGYFGSTTMSQENACVGPLNAVCL